LKKPNLFIVGAPKCGTTALAQWLNEHDEIFVSPSKEPHFFSDEYKLTESNFEYERLFSEAGSNHKWVCEASVWYMFSPTAVDNIISYSDRPKFIAMVRNPIEMVPSMHEQQLYNGNEKEFSLEDAISYSADRLSGKPTKVARGYPSDHLAYLHSCALGWQIKRLREKIRKEDLYIILHDDLKANPEKVFLGLLNFLDVSVQLPSNFFVVNGAKKRRSYLLDRLVKFVAKIKIALGVEYRFNILSKIRAVNKKERSRKPISGGLRRELSNRFEDDVRLLSEEVGRDLSGWLYHE